MIKTPSEITQILQDWNDGDADAKAPLIPFVYDELKGQARGLKRDILAVFAMLGVRARPRWPVFDCLIDRSIFNELKNRKQISLRGDNF